MPNSRLLPIVLAALVPIIGWAPTVMGAAAAPGETSVAAMADIEFYLARGEADACGPGCNEWIAAEGKIDAGAASRLRRLLAKLGRPRPPIYLHSPGGSISGGLELGRLIRDQKLEVSVAHTSALRCDRDKSPEKTCEAQKRSGQALESEFDPSLAMCNSACVYVLAGGAVRRVPPWVKLGIHDVGFDPEQTPPRGALLGQAKTMAHERIQDYLHEMGIDNALLRAASAVPFESKRFLERDEVARFGIDRREFGETAWQFVDKPVPLVSKRFFARTDNDKFRYLDGFVSVSCGAGQSIRLALARDHGSELAGAGPRAVSISVNGQRVDLRDQIPATGVDMRSAWLSTSTLDAAGDNATIGLSGTDLVRNEESAGGMTLDMHGFSAQLARLRKGCDRSALIATAATSPAGPLPFFDPKSLGTLSVPAVQGWPPPKSAAAAPLAPASATAQSASSAVDARTQRGPSCNLQIADAPQQLTGRVTSFLAGEAASARVREIEAELGAKMSPAYVALNRVTVVAYPPSDSWSTMAAIPEGLTVKIGDLVELKSRYRDQSLPCHFIPWTINRLLDHAEEAAPSASGP
jgi:hypothetical protein